jgi:[ribosomal protein S18]-alanine N-acetyltransferase
MTNEFKIARGDVGDAVAMAALHASAFEDAWPESAIEALLARDGVAALLGTREGVLQGFILVQSAADEAEVLTFCVSKDARQSGLGGALLGAACDLARAHGAARIFLEVGESNAAAIKLYARDGFAAVGRRKAYYQHGVQAADALVMRKSLNQP